MRGKTVFVSSHLLAEIQAGDSIVMPPTANALAVGGIGGPGLMGGPAPVIGYDTATPFAVGYGAVRVVLSSAVLDKWDLTS